MKQIVTVIIFTLILASCDRGPKVISAPVNTSTTESKSNTGIFADNGSVDNVGSDMAPVSADVHTVEVLEVLPTDKYVYMRVKEGSEEFWVATGKKEVKIGEKYFYKNGILKRNFESKEYNRIFDKVYLVSNIVAANHGGNMNANLNANTESQSSEIKIESVEVPGSIKISEIVNNPQKYKGQSIQVSGTCTKLNPNIMGRNWIHLKDGSADEYDFVITSDAAVPEGHTVTLKGDVALDKDFGAGYMYKLIVENGEIVN